MRNAESCLRDAKMGMCVCVCVGQADRWLLRGGRWRGGWQQPEADNQKTRRNYPHVSDTVKPVMLQREYIELMLRGSSH